MDRKKFEDTLLGGEPYFRPPQISPKPYNSKLIKHNIFHTSWMLAVFFFCAWYFDWFV